MTLSENKEDREFKKFEEIGEKTTIRTIPVINKTIETELQAIATVAANNQDISSVLDVSTNKNICVMIDHARDIATAFVGAGTEYRIEISEKATGNDAWRSIFSVVCGIASASSIVTDNEEAIGQTQIETGATLPSKEDIVFFKNNTLANSEWVKVVAIDATGGSEHFDIQDGLTNIQSAGTYFNKAEQFVINLDISSVKRLRVIANNNNGTTNRAIVWRAACITSI